MKDFLRNDLTIGDYVITFVRGRYPEIMSGYIDSFTPKKVRININRSNNEYSSYKGNVFAAFPEDCALVAYYTSLNTENKVLPFTLKR